MTDYKKQVDKKHYSFQKYFYKGRWMSYWYQSQEILSREDIKSILDIGSGTPLLKNILTNQRPEIEYKTLDVAEDLNPDSIGDITDIPLAEKSFDAVSAFQVLEHISFDDFEKALVEMKRVSKKYILISLPHFGPSFELYIKFPRYKAIKWSIKLPRPKDHVFCGQHYWEIGKRGYSAKRIKSILERHFTIVDEYIPFENQYHHFFILEKK